MSARAEVVTATGSRPVPQVDEVSAPYFAACADGRLQVQRCPACEHLQHYPRALCVRCGATPQWHPVGGRGHVYTFTVIRQIGIQPFRGEVPYVVAMVELDEGPMLMGNITGCPVDDVSIGMPVEVYMVEAAENIAVPQWKPAAR